MTAVQRKALAALANHAARRSRRAGAPHLRADSTRKLVIEWLQWNDPNGSHADDLAISEGARPYTTAEAWAALSAMLED